MSRHHKLPKTKKRGQPVEVDQGALIHKVLARYPGEFTLFRELLQNSDDAQSDAVQIYFETAGASRDPRATGTDFKVSDIIQWTFKNRGNLFGDEDWTRLCKIAKGNDDPTKVGAFGVGFYSLFSVTDHPTVLSGGTQMQFYWTDDNQLYFDDTKTPSVGESSPWTTIKIPLREPGEMPDKIDFMRFLATSITFMAHLKHVEVFLDGDCLGRIIKTSGDTDTVSRPISLFHSSPLEIMTVCGLQCHQFSIQAEISTEIGEPTLTGIPESSKQCKISSASRTPPQSNNRRVTSTAGNIYTMKADLTLFTAEVDVRVNEKLSKGLLRSTCKSPPSKLNYNLVYTGKDEYDRSHPRQEPKTQPFISVFQGLRADLDGATHSKVFIGHSTGQTTGIGGHMAAPFISTVERESIDFVDKNVAVWNSELLHVGGFLARVVYELELTAIDTLWREAITSGQPKFQDQLFDRFIHVLKFFTFYDSTPSPKVAQQMQRSFYACSASSLRLLSSAGVYHATDIRSFDPLLCRFLKDVPMLPSKVAEAAQCFVNALPPEQRIGTITREDMLQDLGKHTLEEAELLAYLEWQTGSPAEMAKLSKVVNFRDVNGTIIHLSTIRSFIDHEGLGAHIPNGPLPPYLIPRRISKPFSRAQLASLGWEEFTIANWLPYVSQPEIRLANPRYDLFRSADWAESVLYTISLAWSGFSEEVHESIKSTFFGEKCIPVNWELYNPADTYLPVGNMLASDLPVVQFPSGCEINKEMSDLLVALGVQQHFAPGLILKLVKNAKWDAPRLVDYLVKVAENLSRSEINELRSYAIFSGVRGKRGDDRGLFRADELYPPTSTFKQLHLRLIDWSGKSGWEDKSREAKLLYDFGLRRHPPLEDIINLCSKDTDVGQRAFDYLRNNFQSVYSGYKPDRFQDIAFIPAKDTNGVCLKKLGDVFLDYKWEVFGLSVIQHKDRENFFEELGVQRHPSSSLLLRLLKERPRDEGIARQWFRILSNHVSYFAPNELEILSGSSIVPETIPEQEKLEWLTPMQCYLGNSTKPDLYSKLFHFVDFGTEAIPFLRACGAKNEPSEDDIAVCLVENHEKFYKLAGHERFMQELCDLAERHTRISNTTVSELRRYPVLPGRELRETEIIPTLWIPNQIIILNDVDASQLFGDSIVAAPENMSSKLEDFYVLLGSRYLTTAIQEECNPSEEIADHPMRTEHRHLIIPRLRLFLRDCPPQAHPTDIDLGVCENLSVSKTLFYENKKSITKIQSVWAAAKNERGTIKVWISCNATQDMYELAVSLCRVLFNKVMRNDALLLMSILSEGSLDILRKRGYKVDQALWSLQHRDKGGIPNKTSPDCPTALVAPSSSLPIDSATQQNEGRADDGPLPAHAGAHLSDGASDTTVGSITSSTMPLVLDKAANNVRDAYRLVTRIVQGNAASGSTTPLPGVERPETRPNYIQSTVKEAIQACSSRPLLHCGNYTGSFLDERYCNAFDSEVESLQFLGSIREVEVYVGQGTPSFMEEMQDQIDRFVRILTDLAEIYDLPLHSLRVFYNTTAGCIAFNRENTIYLNLWYFDALHYEDVKSDNSRRALLYWFFTIAHELAHNLIPGHNAEHEFLFSAICEEYMGASSKFLSVFG